MKNILITGSTDGIGKATAIQLVKMGHKVIVHGRTQEKAELTCQKIISMTNNVNIDSVWGDYSSQIQVNSIGEQLFGKITHLDVLINNAGIYQTEKEFSKDGLEMTFAVNHFAPFVLTRLLVNLLKEAKDARVVTVSSMIHANAIDFDNLQGEKYFDGSSAYSLSKLCNILFAYKFAEEVKTFGISSNCLHPGVINTKLLHKGWGGGGGSVESGAQTSVYLAISDDVQNVSQKYFVNGKVAVESEIARDKGIQNRLWEETLRLEEKISR